MISDPADLRGIKWGSTNDVLEYAKHPQLAVKLWLAATARDSQATDMRRRGPAIAQLDTHGALQAADMIAGGSPESRKLGQASREALREIGFESDEATTGGPLSEMAKAAAETGGDRQVQCFKALSVTADWSALQWAFEAGAVSARWPADGAFRLLGRRRWRRRDISQ